MIFGYVFFVFIVKDLRRYIIQFCFQQYFFLIMELSQPFLNLNYTFTHNTLILFGMITQSTFILKITCEWGLHSINMRLDLCRLSGDRTTKFWRSWFQDGERKIITYYSFHN